MRNFRCLYLVAAFAAPAVLAQSSAPFCQILDGAEDQAWTAGLGYTAPSKIEAPDGGDVALWSLNGGGGLYYWRTGTGDMDLSGAYDIWAIDGSGGIKLPDRVAALRLDFSFVKRDSNGSALQFDLYPGIYSDLEDVSLEDLYLPFQVLGIQAFNPQISGLIGVAIYPGFDRSFDPRFGIRYAPVESVRLDLMYPESRVTFRPDILELYAGVRHDAVNEFRLEENDPRDSFAFRETRMYVGAAWPLNDLLRFNVELGYAFNREVDFDRNESSRDWGDAVSLRVGIGGPI